MMRENSHFSKMAVHVLMDTITILEIISKYTYYFLILSISFFAYKKCDFVIGISIYERY